MGRKRILIVDDEPNIVALLKAALPKEYEVFTAGDGEEGFRSALSNLPDLILADITMPKMDGYALLQKLRQNDDTNRIPKVILSANGESGAIFRAKELGASDYLIKPFHVSDVPEVIRKFL